MSQYSLASTFRFVLTIALAASILLGPIAPSLHAAETTAESNEAGISPALLAAAKAAAAGAKPNKYKPFAEVTKDAKEYDGLFKMYHKDENLFASIRGDQFDKPFLAPIVIARGMASAGMPLNFGDEWVIEFHRAGDNVHVVRKNIHYEAPEGTPLKKAVEQNYLDSVLMSVPIVSDDPPGGGVLIDFSDIFFTNFANLGLGGLDRSRTTWHKIKAFDDNVELQVKATFSGGGYSSYYAFDDGVIDPRGVTVVLHYSLTKTPDAGYQPRLADQRVGYFISATKDFGSKDPDTNFKRRVNRWRLEKADPAAKLSPPKKQIVWWVENNVPHEYRPYVEEGILEWNKAFEKIGFRNALGVRWQQDGDEFDPEDINYCTFRWITTPFTFAMSGLRSNPITGEMIDGDVVFDASWIRYWQMEYAFLVGMPMPTGQDGKDTNRAATNMVRPMDVGEIISPIMAAKYGYGSPMPSPAQALHARLKHGPDCDCGHDATPQVVPSSWSPLQMMMHHRLSAGRYTSCQYAMAKQQEFRLVALALAIKKKDETDKDKKDDGLPEELVGQLIKEVVMHEVGHSLGLRHNFKASSMLSLDEVNDTSITREKGLTGSVMDYNPVNISPDQDKQGDFATTTIGPYDYWAIEYAYKPISGDEKSELEKIAARSPEGGLAYATDEDLWMSNDPQVQAMDLGDDPLAYGKQRIALAEKLLPEIDDKVIKDGESWARLRSAFSVLLSQYGNAAYLATSYIAGQHFSKHHKGGKDTADPIVPVAGKKQREALEFVTKTILDDKAFKFSPQLLRRLSMETWYHWGSPFTFFDSVDYPVYDRVLAIQRIVINHCLDATVLRRLQNQKLLAADKDPLEMSEVFRTLTDSVWSEVAKSDEKPEKFEISLIRRNLQREHLSKLSTIVIGQQRNSLYDLYGFASFSGSGYQYPADARSLARMHIKEINEKIKTALKDDGEMEDATRAHLEESREQIKKILEARLTANG